MGVGAGPEVIPETDYPPGIYYPYIDSYYAAGVAGSCGSYDIQFAGIPVELMKFTVE